MTSQVPIHSIYNSVVTFVNICFNFYAYPRFLVFFSPNRMPSALNSICWPHFLFPCMIMDPYMLQKPIGIIC